MCAGPTSALPEALRLPPKISPHAAAATKHGTPTSSNTAPDTESRPNISKDFQKAQVLRDFFKIDGSGSQLLYSQHLSATLTFGYWLSATLLSATVSLSYSYPQLPYSPALLLSATRLSATRLLDTLLSATLFLATSLWVNKNSFVRRNFSN